MPESWRAVPGFPGYEINSVGKIRSYWAGGCKPRIVKTPQRVLADRFDGSGYLRAGLYNGSGNRVEYSIHCLVWTVFQGEIPDGYVVHHVNLDPLDNALGNLELKKDGEHKRQHTAARWAIPEYRAKMSESARVRAANPEFRAKLGESARARWADVRERAAQSQRSQRRARNALGQFATGP